MVSFKNICRSITSFVTTPKKPTLVQKEPERPNKKSKERARKRRHKSSMNTLYKAKEWFSKSSIGGAWNGGSHLGNTSKPQKRRRSPSTSPSPRKKQLIRKNHSAPTVYKDGEYLEGTTLVNCPRNDGVSEVPGPSGYSPGKAPEEARASVLMDSDGDALMDMGRSSEPQPSAETREDETSLGGLDDENSAKDDSECKSSSPLSDLSDQDSDECPQDPDNFIEMPKLDREFSGLEESDDEYMASGSSSDSEISEDEMISPPPTRDRSRSRSRRPNPDNAPYRPSPEIVDKNLASNIVSPYAEESDLSEEERLQNKVIIKKSDKKEVAYDVSMEFARRPARTPKLPKGNWSHAESDLYFRLAMRGYEPLIPSNWRIDFATLPTTLFAPPEGPEPYIQPIYESEFRGNRVRDRMLAGLRPEPVIGRQVSDYIKWALRDANIHNRPKSIPTYAIYAMRGSQDSRHALTCLNHRLVTLASRYREAWRLKTSVENVSEPAIKSDLSPTPCYLDRKFPVITGYLICGPIIAVLTLNSDPTVNPGLLPDTAGKLISKFDLSQGGQDVWNALAIAISVIRLRKNILELVEDCPDDPMWMVGEKIEVPDPDL